MTKSEISENTLQEYGYLYDKFNGFECRTMKGMIKLLELVELELLSSKYCPNFIISHSFFNSDVEDSFDTVKVSIRPSIKYNINCEKMKYSFVLVNNDTITKDLITNLIGWISDYKYYSYLDSNIKRLNDVVWSILSSIDEIPWTISFSLGEGILDIADTSIVLGISDSSAENLENIGLFSTDDYWKSLYIEKFKSMLKECNRPYDIVKSKSEFCLDLGIYNRKSINKLIRKFVKRRIECVRVGVGYVETDTTFGLVDKEAVSDEDIEETCLATDNFLIIENKNPTVIEKKAGKNKIVVTYRLTPFEKKTNAYLDLTLKEFLRESGVVLE